MIKKIMIFIFGYLSDYISSCTSNNNLQFLSHVIIIKLSLSSSCSQILLSYLVFKYFGFERTWWMLFHKRVVCTKNDIYVFIYC